MHRFITCALLISLAACSVLPEKHPQKNWSLDGKIGITTPQERAAGFLSWQQTGDEFDIYVSGPLAQGSTRIQGNLNSITLTQGGQVVSGLKPEQFIYEQLGWVFPIRNLPYWLTGKASPFSKAIIQTKDKRLSQIKQDQWTVEFQRYHSYYQLPERIKISQGKWSFLIVVKNWHTEHS